MAEDLSGLPPEQPEESGDLADHEAAFGPDGTGELPEAADATSEPLAPVAQTPEERQAERDAQGRFQKTPRHRAKSQQAGAGDVPRIQELTAKLRAAEAERDALKARPAASPSPPVRDERSTGTVAAPAAESGTSRQAASSPPPTRQKPSEDEVGTKYATYADFVEDLADWVGEQREARRDAKQAQEQQQRTYQEWNIAYQAKCADLRARVADYDTAIAGANQATQAAGIVVPQVLLDAILSSDRGPEVEYWLATHVPDYHELIRDAWSVNQFSSVGMVRRVLESKLPTVASSQRSPREAAGVTGAAPTLAVVPAPRPPTPVRTGPLKIGDDPPDDDAGLDAHEAHYYRKSR